jgi:SAM-dependent methyltransferase
VIMARIEPFNQYMTEYEDWFEKNHFAYISELKAVKKQLPESGKSIEIGVGTGRFAAPLGIELGLEPSAPMRKIAEQKGIRMIGGVAEELPFADGRFELALMVTTICFLDDINGAFREVRRILKPTGYFIAGFIDKDSPLGRLYENNEKDNEFYRIATFYSVDEILSLLKRVGFSHFNFVQTIFKRLNEIHRIEPVIDGYGQGSFAVIRGQK